MRIIVMGTGPFAVPMFESILAAGHDVPVVVTRPLPPARGRKKPATNPVREAADQHGLKLLDPADVNAADIVAELADLKADLLVVCDFGQILSPATLGVAPLGGINLHGSLLPQYRGAAPVQWAIINGDATTGVTVIHMTPKLDGGPALCQLEVAIEATETAEQLEHRLAALGAPAVIDAIEILSEWDQISTIGTLQDQQLVTQAPRLHKQLGDIPWSKPATAIINLHRGLYPWPGCFTQWQRENGRPLRLIIIEMTLVENTSADMDVKPGTVVANPNNDDRESLCVATGDGCISIRRIQPAGKRVLEIGEFLRGYQLKPGVQLG
ncbi:MAG: methionyl-tRNA formyltransferase [Planctomycetaceae bacterium]|jgi:methionyl-tRNA formyltransferase|nr:methionyl-tRNA formyltransferase [Planctomycetaceae bacterium]